MPNRQNDISPTNKPMLLNFSRVRERFRDEADQPRGFTTGDRPSDFNQPQSPKEKLATPPLPAACHRRLERRRRTKSARRSRRRERGCARGPGKETMPSLSS
jgi:hypothetical protein